MLDLLNIGKSFSSQTAIKELTLSIKEGEFFSLLGPSGCGKTTLLRIIAGLEQASEGQILLHGKRVDPLPARQRPFNMVFQRYALFPHMTVEQNVAYGLQLKKIPVAEIQKRVDEVLTLVGLQDFRQRLPETLSGGQAQRVAIARALINKPKVLLLDEPLSALDQKLREHMQKELRALQRQLGLTFIYVTHDQEEALTLSDRLAVMDQGVLEFVGTPQELFVSTESSFVADFVGSRTSVTGQVVSSDAEFVTLQLQNQSVIKTRHHLPAEDLRVGKNLSLYIRKAMVVKE